MDRQSVIAKLTARYPGAPIAAVAVEEPTEIICEFDSGAKHPEWSLAVAVIDKSKPHYHNQTVEIYRILTGELKLHVENEELILYEGQEYTILPGKVHWAEGNETWVEVYCTPAYSSADHHLVTTFPAGNN